jgi:excisionase family DNA binding protein
VNNCNRGATVGITLGEVARQFGVSKGSISKAISKGKLSATRSADGSSWDIDPAEVLRFLSNNPIPPVLAECE